MSDPNAPQQPSEEELRAYMDQLREADAAQVLVQAFQLLGTGAEVKLGRADARVLIDAMAGMVGGLQGKLPDELTKQMTEGVRQLQLAQVDAEGGAAKAEGAGAGKPESSGDPATAPPQPAKPKASDRLWIPGQ